MTSPGKGRATQAIHAGQTRSGRTVGPAVERGSTVILPNAAALYAEAGVTYGRQGLGAQAALCEALAEMEGARGVRLFPSGLAGVTGAMLAVLKAGDEVLVSDAIYKPTRRFCTRVLERFGVGTRYFEPRATAAEVLATARPATRMIVMESPGSLTFEMQDVPAIAAMARQRGILTLLDNTWAAGFWFQPLAHGVDLSVQSLTKYVGGHSDVFMGSAATADPDLVKALDDAVIDIGWSVSPDDAYQILRGLRTLPTRLERHFASARRIVAWLDARPEVAEVLWPAAPASPDHALWRRDYSGAAGLFSVVLKATDKVATHAFLDALEIFRLGYSWGGFESLAIHADPQFGQRQFKPRFEGPVVRLSIGLEDEDDLIADLERGFAALARA